MRQKIFLLFALLCAVAQGAWADEVTTVLDDGVFTGFTATGGSNTGNEGYDKLVDGNTATKWCTNTSPFYVEFHSSGLIVPTGYIMTTAGDTQSYSSRNPKSWTIKAKVDANDNWTELVSVTDDATMPASNYTPVEFTISGNTTAYKYFRLDVSATQGDNWFQLSEFQFIGTTTDNTNITVKPSLSGSGTSESPYTIGSTADWDVFASKVNSGTSYSGLFVMLTSDITVTTMAGTSEANSFQGTFLGCGHTLTFTKGSAEAAFGEDYCAPFRYTKDATIRDLNVAGDIYTSKKFAAGIVARPNGTTNIINCHVSTVIHSSVSADGGDGTHGGFTAYPQGNVNFTGCVYTGRMFTTTGSTKCGGFVGWHNGKTYTFVNSLYAPAPNITAAAGETAITTDCATFVRGGSAGTGCYYTETMGEAQGTPAYTSAPAGEVSKPVTVNATTYYMLCTVSGVRSKYLYTGSAITVTPTVTYNGTTLAEGTDYTYATSPATVHEKGDYTLTVTGQGGTYSGAKTISFAVADGIPVTSDMTTLEDFAFVVNQDVTISSRIQISGDVTLILGEGTTLTAPKGIELSQGNSLTINGPGALTINGCDYNKSGIGAAQVGTLTINGGIINVISGRHGAGIGGDANNTVGGTIIINGGVVNASSHPEGWGAGIGGGRNFWERGACGVCGDIIINGGQVTAIGGFDDANDRYAQGIGVGQVYSSSQSAHLSGSLTLSWSSPYDFVYSSSFASVYMGSSIGSITIADGKQFVIAGTETVIDNTTENLADIISGKVICGYNYDRPIALTDGDTYGRVADLRVSSATYTKTTDRVDQYHSWLVPFDHTITATDAEKFKFYKLYMIANAIAPDATMTDDMWLYVRPMAAGDMLHANMPYLYVPLEAVTDYVFTANGNILKPKADGAVATMQTMEDTYTLYGTYEPTSPSASDPFYYMNINGNLSLGNDGTVTVGSFRWIMRQTSKYGGTPAYARQMIIFDVDSGEATGIVSTTDCTESTDKADVWYSFDGRKLQGKPSRAGVYIYKGVKVAIK